MWYQVFVKWHNRESNHSCFFINNNYYNNNHSQGKKKMEFQEIISFQGTESWRIWCHCLSDSADNHTRCWEWSKETWGWCCYDLLDSWFQYIINKYSRDCSHSNSVSFSVLLGMLCYLELFGLKKKVFSLNFLHFSGRLILDLVWVCVENWYWYVVCVTNTSMFL